jgi:hypothetical protein
MNLNSLSTLVCAAAMALLLGEFLPMERTSGLITPAAAQPADPPLTPAASIQLLSNVVPDTDGSASRDRNCHCGSCPQPHA